MSQFNISNLRNITKFGGSYFQVWKHNLKLVLKSEKLLKVVEGNELCPITPPPTPGGTVNHTPATGAGSKEQWLEKDTNALTIITNCLENSQISHITSSTTSKEAWDELSRLFESQDSVTKMYLKEQLTILKMKDNDSMIKHIHTFRSLLDQLSAAGSPMSNEDAVLALMRSMPSSYRNFLISIRGQTLTLQVLITYLLQEETMLKNLDQGSSSSTSAYAIKGKTWPIKSNASRNTYKFPNNKFYSTNKFKSGPSTYHQANSSKPFYNNNNSYQSSYNRKPLVCFYCGKPNHHIKDCRKRIYDENNGKQRSHSNTNSFSKELLYAIAYNTQVSSPETWIVDTGATSHMAHNRNNFLNYKPIFPSKFAYTIDGTSHAILGTGNVEVLLPTGIPKVIPNVLHVPNLHCNLFSVKQLAQSGGTFSIKGNIATLTNSNHQLIASCHLDNDLYVLGHSISPITPEDKQLIGEQVLSSTTNNMIINWHNRLGHISFSRLQELINNQLVDGINLKHIPTNNPFCESCIFGKQHKLSFPKHSTTRASNLLDLIHSDIKGKTTPTHTGFQYFITFIDDYSQYTIIYLLKLKSQAFSKFKAFAENQLGRHIKVLRTDNGGEYISEEFRTFCIEHGIERQYTTPFTPEQNGVSERKNRTLFNAILSMLHRSQFSIAYWGEAILTATYLQNRLPTKALNNVTPYELWKGRKPNLAHLRTFGCTAYALIPKERTIKSTLLEKSIKCWFLGYAQGTKGYRLQDQKNKSIIISRNVIFLENDFKILNNKFSQDDSYYDDLLLLSNILKPYYGFQQQNYNQRPMILHNQGPVQAPIPMQIQPHSPNTIATPSTPQIFPHVTTPSSTNTSQINSQCDQNNPPTHEFDIQPLGLNFESPSTSTPTSPPSVSP